MIEERIKEIFRETCEQIFARRNYGKRYVKSKGMKIVWSNASASWYVADKIKSFNCEFDANEVLVQVKDYKEAKKFERTITFLPQLPLYYASSEAMLRGEYDAKIHLEAISNKKRFN